MDIPPPYSNSSALYKSTKIDGEYMNELSILTTKIFIPEEFLKKIQIITPIYPRLSVSGSANRIMRSFLRKSDK